VWPGLPPRFINSSQLNCRLWILTCARFLMLFQSDRRRGRLRFIGGGRVAAAAASVVAATGRWGVVTPALAVAALAGIPQREPPFTPARPGLLCSLHPFHLPLDVVYVWWSKTLLFLFHSLIWSTESVGFVKTISGLGMFLAILELSSLFTSGELNRFGCAQLVCYKGNNCCSAHPI
jgi:hypothetical protein